MNRQEHYRQRYRKLKPDWQDSLRLYRSIVDQLVEPNTCVLDIGCGHADFLRPVYCKTPHAFGIDPDTLALRKNTTIPYVATAQAAVLPFEDEVFDVIALAWVLEHLDAPQHVFREMHRVLRPCGVVVFLTPNVWNYNVWLIRAIPNVFHDLLVRRLYQRQEHDTYPVRYNLNSSRKIDHTLLPLGFSKQQLLLNGDPSYISFNAPLFRLACLIERVLDMPSFQWARVHLIGVYRKGR